MRPPAWPRAVVPHLQLSHPPRLPSHLPPPQHAHSAPTQSCSTSSSSLPYPPETPLSAWQHESPPSASPSRSTFFGASQRSFPAQPGAPSMSELGISGWAGDSAAPSSAPAAAPRTHLAPPPPPTPPQAHLLSLPTPPLQLSSYEASPLYTTAPSRGSYSDPGASTDPSHSDSAYLFPPLSPRRPSFAYPSSSSSYGYSSAQYGYAPAPPSPSAATGHRPAFDTVDASKASGHTAVLGGQAWYSSWTRPLEEPKKPPEKKPKEPPPPPEEPANPPQWTLNPPKPPPTAWQLFFAEELAKAKAAGKAPSGKAMNVGAVAKMAAAVYAEMSQEQMEPYIAEAKRLKAQHQKDLSDYLSSLPPGVLKAENHLRAQGRKAGTSRKANLKDPAAPKRPLTPYFVFLKTIRTDKAMRDGIWGEGTWDAENMTGQSKMASRRWKEMSANEKEPFNQAAEKSKQDYENAKREYERRAAIMRGEAWPPQGSGTGAFLGSSGGAGSSSSSRAGPSR